LKITKTVILAEQTCFVIPVFSSYYFKNNITFVSRRRQVLLIQTHASICMPESIKI